MSRKQEASELILKVKLKRLIWISKSTSGPKSCSLQIKDSAVVFLHNLKTSHWKPSQRLVPARTPKTPNGAVVVDIQTA